MIKYVHNNLSIFHLFIMLSLLQSKMLPNLYDHRPLPEMVYVAKVLPLHNRQSILRVLHLIHDICVLHHTLLWRYPFGFKPGPQGRLPLTVWAALMTLVSLCKFRHLSNAPPRQLGCLADPPSRQLSLTVHGTGIIRLSLTR